MGGGGVNAAEVREGGYQGALCWVPTAPALDSSISDAALSTYHFFSHAYVAGGSGISCTTATTTTTTIHFAQNRNRKEVSSGANAEAKWDLGFGPPCSPRR